MPIESKSSTIKNNNNEEVEAYTVTFTNGGLDQLKKLKSYYGKTELIDIIELGMSLLERIKLDGKNKANTDEPDQDKTSSKDLDRSKDEQC